MVNNTCEFQNVGCMSTDEDPEEIFAAGQYCKIDNLKEWGCIMVWKISQNLLV